MMDNTPVAVKLAKLTETQRNRIVRLRTQENMSVKQIMNYTGHSYKMIIRHLKDLGIYKKKPKGYR